ncbi:hypothetical protein N8D56_19790 [Devosia sp. A8/3-2]|nr:hypothetical protein N8D56_19790 [Devosia sp. A8/3-2]
MVEEGNRRVTALKLLETPAPADGTSVSRQFKRLAKIYAENPIRELEARLFETRDDVLPWKRRRHMTAGSGVGLAPWKPFAKGRANRDIGLDAPRSLAVVEFFGDDKSDAWAEILEALDGRWTTVDRVLNAAPFKETLGVVIDPKSSAISFENGDLKAGGELLKRVLSTMAAPDFEFADIEDKDDRKKFIDQFADYNVRAKAGEAPQPSQAPNSAPSTSADGYSTDGFTQREAGSDQPPPDSSPSATAEAPATPSRRSSADANRKTLAPPDGPRLLPVQGIRLLPLYNECRKLKVKGNENAAAFLVRVFIELSSENYLQEKAVQLPRSLREKSITDWEDYKVKLSDKIAAVMLHIDPTKKAPVFVQARHAISKESVGSFSITMLHSYFHNRHVLPDEATIKASWDGWEAYLR